MLLRQISAVRATPGSGVVLGPRAGFGRHGSHHLSLDDGIWSGTEYDVTQRQLRGNLPQAFVHALLLECAATLTGGEHGRPAIGAAS